MITGALSNRVKKYDNVEVQFGKQVVGLEKCSEGWRTVSLHDGSEIKTKLLVCVMKYCNSLNTFMYGRLVLMVHGPSYDN